MSDIKENLSSKISAEYKEFITEIQNSYAETAIESAYEIVWKDNITLYCEKEENIDLSDEECKVLLAADNILDKIYECWENSAEFCRYSDVHYALKHTAEDLLQEQKQKQKQKNPIENKEKHIDEQTSVYKVTICETLKRSVYVSAKNRFEAEQIVNDRWRDGEYVLGADDFVGVSFQSKLADKMIENGFVEKSDVKKVRKKNLKYNRVIGRF